MIDKGYLYIKDKELWRYPKSGNYDQFIAPVVFKFPIFFGIYFGVAKDDDDRCWRIFIAAKDRKALVEMIGEEK